MYYDEENKRYSPRAILFDLDPGTMDSIKAGPFSEIFSSENFMFGSTGGSNNWAKGHYAEGSDLSESIMNIIRREAEKCDLL